ncbi:MAG: sigma-70 family RNA polymerase sigma factor [Acidobacteria bacterium]|nr:sigma-70 family RNA polymerase sigma factor [Acidobacteriota bacterium]
MSSRDPVAEQNELYARAVREFGRALDRLSAGYEGDVEKRRDLRQEIHLRLWRSLTAFDGRCSLRTWTFRVAHNTAATWVDQERRSRSKLVTLEEVEPWLVGSAAEPDLDRPRALAQLTSLIQRLKPLDRQIMLCYLEELDNATIADITGLTPAHVAVKIHRIKAILSRRFIKDSSHA